MPSVVRSTFWAGVVALATVASLTACGDKVQQSVTQPGDTVVHSVTVSPSTVSSLAVGAKVTLAVSVDADAGVSDRTVTWSSSNTAVATVDQTGTVTGVSGGTTTIIAASKANPQVTGAAVVTVAASVSATVTIGQINQTICVVGGGCNSVPATLTNVANQLDVTLNVDPGTQTLSEVDLVMNCTNPPNSGTDTVVARQALGSSDLIPAGLDAASSPLTLSFNTAAFNATTGVVSFKNGGCTLKGKAITSNGTQTASSLTQLTLNNVNFIQASLITVPTAPQVATATDANGLLWHAGAVSATAIPVIYTPVSIVSGAIALINSGNDNALGKNGATVLSGGTVGAISGIAPATGVLSASFPLSTTATGGVGGAVVDTLGVQVTTVDNTGNPGPTLNSAAANSIRLDNRAPNIGTVDPPVFIPGTQNTANGWVGANFLFAISAGSLKADSAVTDNLAELIVVNGNGQKSAGGVDKVTISTQFAPQGTAANSTAWATFTSVSALAETQAATGSVAYDLRLVICDALNNCSTTPTLTTFGVDKTPPTATTAAGPKNNEIDGIGIPISSGTLSVSASDPQGANGVTGSGFGANPVLVTETQLAPSGATGMATTCVIGVPLAPNTGCKAGSLQPLTFAVSAVDPGQYALSYVVVDQAGNQSTPVTLNYYLDGASQVAPAPAFAPQMSGGIGIPASITNGATFSASGVDNMDFASANAVLLYPGVATVMIPAVSSAAGVAFDNVLTRSSSVTVTLANFMRSLGVINAGAIVVPQTKPSQIGIRGLDAANNLSQEDIGVFPPTNISTPTTLVIGTDLNDFSIALAPTTVSNGTGVLPRATTLTATVTAVDANHGTPFTQVCFYIINPNGQEAGQANAVTGGAGGEFAQLGCTSVTNTTLVGPNKLISSTMSFDPDARYGIAGTLNFVAVGITANGDALVTGAAAVLTLAQ